MEIGNWTKEHGIDKILFPIVDIDTSDKVVIDKYRRSSYAISYPGTDNENHIRQYDINLPDIEVPLVAAKTKINDANDSQKQYIRRDHVDGHRLMRWKQALDVIFDGVFYARGPGGVDLKMDIDFERDSENKFTHTIGTNLSVADALTQMQKKLKEQGASLGNMIVIMGRKYLSRFFDNPEIHKYRASIVANYLLRQERLPKRLVNQESGLVVHEVFYAPEMSTPLYICSYSPGVPYKTPGCVAATPWIADNKAAMLSLDSPRYSIQRGVNALTENGKTSTLTGDIVFDSFVDKTVRYMRSQSRHMFIPGNVNHIAVSTGTFPDG